MGGLLLWLRAAAYSRPVLRNAFGDAVVAEAFARGLVVVDLRAARDPDHALVFLTEAGARAAREARRLAGGAK
jgi:hypothetical protein